MKREAHCCAASFYEVQSLWMDLVAPGLQTFDLDLRNYRCIYEENFDCAKAPSEPLTLRRQWPPSTNLVKYPIRVELDEKCTSFLPQPMLPKDVSLTAKDQSLKCAFSACGTGISFTTALSTNFAAFKLCWFCLVVHCLLLLYFRKNLTCLLPFACHHATR